MIPDILSYAIYSVITLFLLIVIVIEITTHLKSVTHLSQRILMDEINLLKEKLKKLEDRRATAINELNSLINEEINRQRIEGKRSKEVSLDIYDLEQVVKGLQSE